VTQRSTGLEIIGATKADEAPILGIDLGTTFSLAAYMTPQGPRLVRDETGDARVPSVLAFGADGTVTIGKEARHRIVADPSHTVYSVKRLIGRTMADLEADLSFVPYSVVEREIVAGRKVLHVVIEDREHTPEELSAMVLTELADRASKELGRQVRRAVVTVPAYFDESQRQATRDAGRIAGLDVVRIVNEPTAAALAYGIAQRREGTVAVYDFGGGTFDCSILALQQGVFKVLSTHGDTHLGGDDVDLALLHIVEADLPAALTADAVVRQSLREACEKAKIELSSADSSIVDVELPEKDFRYTRAIARAELEALLEPLIARTLHCCRAALRDAGKKPSEIDEVVLVGGSSRIPLVRRRVEEQFGRPAHCELNPDEVVAMGAAVQASILSGEMRQILLLDITPLSLGIETMGGAVSRLIARNSTIPAQATEHFTTFVDNQTGVDIHVLQGERELAKDCRSLGKFKLSGIPPLPAGIPKIAVTFTIDANGMLHVAAREERSGKEASIEIQPSHGLSRDEVDRMILESVAQAREDFAARRRIDLQNKAEANLRHAEKGIARAGDQLNAAQRQAIETTRRELQSAMQADDLDALQKALDEFDAATFPLAEAMMNSAVRSELVHKKASDV
jgi:Fe-S protein assembly chaperone HscA